jgi:D-glycero-alpha-D-manno-heptose-7-phosphate kinase
MIITKIPLRIGLLGGGTDLPSYYRERGVRVLNGALDEHM